MDRSTEFFTPASTSDALQDLVAKDLERTTTSIKIDSRDQSVGIPMSEDEKRAHDTNHASLTDWNGPDDPDNPQNWPMWQRAYHILVPAVFCFSITFGTSVITPAVPDLMSELGVSRTIALVSLTVYMMGLVFGPIISAPLSEQYGRKVIYVATCPVFMLFMLGAAFSKNIGSLLVCRFFAGFVGSPVMAVTGGTNADVFEPQLRAISANVFFSSGFLGPSLGAFAGGFLVQYATWRWTQWLVVLINLPVFILLLLGKETYKPAILRRRARKLGIRPPPPTRSIVATLVYMTTRPVHMLLTEAVVFFFALYAGFNFAVIYCFFAAFPFVFSQAPYFFSPSQVGMTFLAIALGTVLASLTIVIIDRKIYVKKHEQAVRDGAKYARPEHRLYSSMLGSIGLPIGLFWFGWTAHHGVHWAVPVVAAIPFGWGNVCLFGSSTLYQTDVYGAANGASALAANGIIRYILGGVFPLFTVQMYEALGIGWTNSLLGFLSLLMLPIPWVLFRYGTAIRKRSHLHIAM